MWAGLSLGGNLLAAPAKFQVPNLDLSTFLQIGKAQFDWLAYGEWFFTIAIVLSSITICQKRVLFLTIPFGAFIIQRAFIMPALDERTVQIIAGQQLPESNLHVVFVVLEIIKFTSLVAVGFILFNASRMESSKSC